MGFPIVTPHRTKAPLRPSVQTGPTRPPARGPARLPLRDRPAQPRPMEGMRKLWRHLWLSIEKNATWLAVIGALLLFTMAIFGYSQSAGPMP